MHSREFRVVQVPGDNDKDDALSGISGGSKGSKGKGRVAPQGSKDRPHSP